MKIRPQDRMRDPFYAQLMFLIEQMICAADREAKEQGFTLKDSQAQSALTKARGLAAGKTPKIEESTDLERILKALILRIGQAPKHMKEQLVDADGSEHEKALRVADWILAIEAVLASIKTRRSDLPGSRDYLDFAQEFVAQAKERQ